MTASKHSIINGGIKIISTLCVTALVACSAVGSDSSVDATNASDDNAVGTDSAATAVASLFGGSASASMSQPLTISKDALNLMVEQGQEQAEFDTCDFLDQGPGEVVISAYGDPGTYGAEDYTITVAEEDFCTLPDGTETTGDGPDGEGRVAAFELEMAVSGTCVNEDSSETIVEMQAGSAGVFRNNDDYYPQIFGTFTFVIDGDNSMDVDCTIYLNEDQTVDFAQCTDENGVVVEQSDTSECEFDTGEE